MVTVLAMLSAGVSDADTDEPLTLKEAQASPQWPKFQKAVAKELQSHIENGTWELVSPRQGVKVLIGRWVFKIKKDRYGNILKQVSAHELIRGKQVKLLGGVVFCGGGKGSGSECSGGPSKAC